MEKTVIFKVDSALLDTFKAATTAAERTVSQQLRILMREFVSAKPVNGLTRASAEAAKAERIKAADAATKAEYIDMLTNGRDGQTIKPWQIRVYHGNGTPKQRARDDAILREAMAELGITEG